MMPQTYGPFYNEHHLKIASKIVDQANICWSRDEAGYNFLRNISEKHNNQNTKLGVDVAFALPTVNALNEISLLLLSG